MTDPRHEHVVERACAVLSTAGLGALARTRRGRYVLNHVSASAQAVRLAGDALMGFGAGRRSFALLLAARQSSWPLVAFGVAASFWPSVTTR